MGKEKAQSPVNQISGAMDKALADARTLQQQGRGEIYSDVQGSYTGCPVDGDKPVQDADDL